MNNIVNDKHTKYFSKLIVKLIKSNWMFGEKWIDDEMEICNNLSC